MQGLEFVGQGLVDSFAAFAVNQRPETRLQREPHTRNNLALLQHKIHSAAKLPTAVLGVKFVL